MGILKTIGQIILEGIAKALWNYLILQRSIQKRHELIDELLKEHMKSIDYIKNNGGLSAKEKDAILVESARRIVYGK